MKVLNFGGKKEFTDRTPLEELYNRYHLTTDLIVEDVAKLLQMPRCREVKKLSLFKTPDSYY